MVGLSVIQDKVEAGFNRLNQRRPDGRPGRLLFPPQSTAITDAVDLKAVFRRAFMLLLYFIASFAVVISIFLTVIVTAVFSHYSHHRIHHIHWRLIKLLYSIALQIFFDRDPPMDYAIAIVNLSALSLAWLLALRWAWNRRAKRLRREGNVTLPVEVAVSSIWPPPPTVSVAPDMEAKR